MKFYGITRVQVLPTSLTDAWKFFSSPDNLAKITPKQMGFAIVHCSGREAMYAGQIIRYRIRIFPFYTAHWVTEITHVHEPYYFVDEQRAGPYALWHHQHHFREVPGGVEVTDEVTYAIPWGILGTVAHTLFVERQLNSIFDFRHRALALRFPDKATSYKTA